MSKSYIVDDTYEGIRLDKWIRNKLGNVPQGLIEKSLRTGKIKLNKKNQVITHEGVCPHIWVDDLSITCEE